MFDIQADAKPSSAARWSSSRSRLRASAPVCSATDVPMRMISSVLAESACCRICCPSAAVLSLGGRPGGLSWRAPAVFESGNTGDNRDMSSGQVSSARSEEKKGTGNSGSRGQGHAGGRRSREDGSRPVVTAEAEPKPDQAAPKVTTHELTTAGPGEADSVPASPVPASPVLPWPPEGSMAEPSAARGVAPSDLGSYQHAVRLVLTNDFITAARPRAGALAAVLRWADLMARDFAELLGYTLVATAHQVRLVRRLDTLDGTQRAVFAAKNGRPFDRRRLAHLCLVLAVFQRSRIEISLADLVRAFAPTANAIDGLGFDATITEHKRAVVDVLDWLADHGALRLSDGSAENWAHDSERGDALYDIDHDICTSLFRPARPIQHLPGAVGLLNAADVSAKRSAQREAAARRARRLLLELPVLYYATLDGETAAALRRTDLADNLARITGLVVERRAEGVMLVDPTGRFPAQPVPGRGGAVNRTAGLLLAKVADLLEDPDSGPALTRIPVPPADDDLRDLLERIDAGMAPSTADHDRDLAWPPAAPMAQAGDPQAETPDRKSTR